MVGEYLDRLGVPAGASTLPHLTALHAAHAATFPHDTVWMVRGRVPDLEEGALVESLLAGEGGACMQLNVGLGWLLRRLGYDVTLVSATAQAVFQEQANVRADDHCVLLVDLPEGVQVVDVGTGTGHRDPLPLRPGTYAQGCFTYAVKDLGGGRWRVEHDRRPRALRAVELVTRPVALSSFEALYDDLARSPDSPYRQAPWAQRRTRDAVEMLHLRTLRVREADGWHTHRLAGPQEWAEVMRERFGLRLPGLTDAELDRVWALTGDGDHRGLVHDVVGAGVAGGVEPRGS